MKEYQIYKNIICIDIKSFYASVECALRGLDPFTSPLVVADTDRGDGAITLAVTPFLKTKGVPSRTRVYQIDKELRKSIIFAKPRMKTYLEYTMKIIEIYLSYVADEDLYVYSIDEAFLDLTPYLKLYNKTAMQIASEIIQTLKDKLKLPASCGIGPNMLMAKLALDIDSKKSIDSISQWEYDDLPKVLWPVSPLSKMWGIGRRMEENLNNLGYYTIGDIANSDPKILKDKFGILGEELYYHTHGIDLSLVQDKIKLRNKAKSLGGSQILFKDYYPPEIYTIILEMADETTRRLRMAKKKCRQLSFGVGYDAKSGGGFSRQETFDYPTNSFLQIYQAALKIFDKYYESGAIRSIYLSLGKLTDDNITQYSLFDNIDKLHKEYQLLSSIDQIKTKYGRNAVNRLSSETEASTIKERNKMVGGHHE